MLKYVVVTYVEWDWDSILADDKLANKNYAGQKRVFPAKNDDDCFGGKKTRYRWKWNQSVLCFSESQLPSIYGKLSSLGE